ncbi:hypothetical protein [Candidatus Nitrososphaera sp. FF02]|uniref:hypothetical protein n=1 Tax=Candidatus Nitrososphaera sp. FF02 TaxID=3398226 RepID=UPI0039ED32CB
MPGKAVISPTILIPQMEKTNASSASQIWAGRTYVQVFLLIAMVTGSLSIAFVETTINRAYAQTSEELGYRMVEGTFEDKELGFSMALPDSMEAFVYEYDSGGQKALTLQIHPEFDSSSTFCCPNVDPSPVVFLLQSEPLEMVRTPAQLPGDMYAAIQGYNMRMSIEELNDMEVLTVTMHSDNDRYGIDYDNVGKFYFMNSGERYLSYGLWASEENYPKYLEAFEESARSIVFDNVQPVNLQLMFQQYAYPGIEVQTDGSVLYPEIITPSIIESVGIDEGSNTLQIDIDEPYGNSFLILNSGALLAGPHVITFDGEPVESTTLSNENGEYLMVFYDDSGRHQVEISGTAVIPEFGPIAAMLMAAGIGIVTVTRYMHK